MIAVHVKQSEERWPGVRAFVSDSDLILALRRGDEAAFALLIDRIQATPNKPI